MYYRYQAGYSGAVSSNYEEHGKPRANSWAEHICDLLPFRSSYIGNRCFFTISSENLNVQDLDGFIRSQFSDDFMQDVKLELRLANVNKLQIYQELLNANILKVW